MSAVKDGGPAACGKRGCNEAIARKQGNQFLCAKHYRFAQMRSLARRDGKAVPSYEQLENISTWDGMTCRDCKRPMNWLREEGSDTQLTLQHYRSGSMGFVCLSCNTRHASMEGDSYCGMRADHKQCPSCKAIKHRSKFSADNGRSGPLKRKSKCKDCSNSSSVEWKRANRDAYNAYQRAWRASRKEAAMLLAREVQP